MAAKQDDCRPNKHHPYDMSAQQAATTKVPQNQRQARQEQKSGNDLAGAAHKLISSPS
jgi:hypothetical protein